jgi:hypothetical protein
MRKYKLTPVEKAIAKAKWKASTLMAHLKALDSDDWQTTVEHVAHLTFLTGVAASVDKVPRTNVDLRIIAGASNTLLEVAVYERLTDLQRGSMSAGLLAIERLQPTLSDHAMTTAEMTLRALMGRGGVYGHHFQEIFK